MRRSLRAVLVGGVVALGACSSPSASEDVAVEVDEASGTIVIRTDAGEAPIVEGSPETTAPAEPAATELPVLPDQVQPIEGEVDGEGVLVAAIVVATGDIDAALDEGIVTPAEVEAAILAIEDGTLSEWITE
ncbi:MAG: hypothetical protein AAFZ07_15385 [Actinomycetota bacterium]